MRQLQTIPLTDLTEQEKEMVDQFILRNSTNGEFLNTIKYLNYHPKNRFHDDSIVVIDKNSKTLRAVMMAAKKDKNNNSILSHPGTTFAGPIIERKMNLHLFYEIMKYLLEYYESKYDKIQIRNCPILYTGQPFGTIEYYLLQHGYQYSIAALSNIINLRALKTKQDLFILYDSKRRNQIKKALRENAFLFYRKNGIEKVAWDNMEHNLKKKFSVQPTHTYREISELCHRFPQNIEAYYMFKPSGEYGAFALIYKLKHVFHTQYLDLNYEYSTQYPNLLLIHHLMSQAMEEGFSYFSFGTSTENGGSFLNEGLFEYKAGYGGGDIILPLFTKEI